MIIPLKQKLEVLLLNEISSGNLTNFFLDIMSL